MEGTVSLFEGDGKTCMLVAVQGVGIVGCVAVADTVRTEAKVVARALRDQGLEVYMLTG